MLRRGADAAARRTGVDDADDDLSLTALTSLSWESNFAGIGDWLGAADESENIMSGLASIGSTGPAITVTVTEDTDGTDFTYIVTVCGKTANGSAFTVLEL